MTISYSDNFTKLLFRWRGSIWKSICLHLLVFLVIYYAINIWLRVGASKEQIEEFDKVRIYCIGVISKIPLLFLLGFYVSMIVSRWWNQFENVAWPDRFIMLLASCLIDKSDKARLYRRTIARWCNLASVLAWRGISVRILRRFPTVDHIVKAGLMTEKERLVLDSTDSSNGQYFLPLFWVQNLIKRCHSEKLLNEFETYNLIEEVQRYRVTFGVLLCYDWVPVPLVYTQVATIATYGYFAITLIADQTYSVKGIDIVDTYIPIFTILQFIFYMGWLRVGEALMYPFGEDDDDFEMNYILDRNVSVAYMLADTIHGQLPEPEPDRHFEKQKIALPHTLSSLRHKDIVFNGHLVNFNLKDKEMRSIEPEEIDQFDHRNKAAAQLQNVVKMIQIKKPKQTDAKRNEGQDEQQPLQSSWESSHTSSPQQQV